MSCSSVASCGVTTNVASWDFWRVCGSCKRHLVAVAGLFQMDCIAVHKPSWIWYLMGPILGLGVLALGVLWLVLNYRARLLQAWENLRILALKRR